MKVAVTFGARALVGANDGLDAIACAERYAGALRDALAREWPAAEIAVSFTDDRAPTRATADAPERAETERATIERTALDLAWVVRQMAPWGG